MDAMKKPLAMGADRLLLVDDIDLDKLDSVATVKVLAAAIEKDGPFRSYSGWTTGVRLGSGARHTWAGRGTRAPARIAGPEAGIKRRFDFTLEGYPGWIPGCCRTSPLGIDYH